MKSLDQDPNDKPPDEVGISPLRGWVTTDKDSELTDILVALE